MAGHSGGVSEVLTVERVWVPSGSQDDPLGPASDGFPRAQLPWQ